MFEPRPLGLGRGHRSDRHGVIERHPALALPRRLKGDVGFLRSQRFEKLTMRLKPRTEVSAHLARRPRTAPFEALHPLDGRGLAHPKARRSRPPAHLSPNHRVDHPVAQVLRICTGHPCWPPPSQQVESEQCQFGNPNQFKLDTACSSRLPRARRARAAPTDRDWRGPWPPAARAADCRAPCGLFESSGLTSSRGRTAAGSRWRTPRRVCRSGDCARSAEGVSRARAWAMDSWKVAARQSRKFPL